MSLWCCRWWYNNSSIFSPTATAQSGVLRAPTAGCWFSLPLLSPTDLNFLLLVLYNNLTPTLLPASVTISNSIRPRDSQGYILIFLDRMHLLFTQVHFLFWQLGRVGGQYTTLYTILTLPETTLYHCHHYVDNGTKTLCTIATIENATLYNCHYRKCHFVQLPP